MTTHTYQFNDTELTIDDLYTLWCLHRPEHASPNVVFSMLLNYVRTYFPDTNLRTRNHLAADTDKTLSVLMGMFALSHHPYDVSIAAKSWWTPKTTLTIIASTATEEFILWGLLENMSTPPQALRILAQSTILPIRREVLSHPNVTRTVLIAYKDEPVEAIRFQAAHHPESCPAVRRFLFENLRKGDNL